MLSWETLQQFGPFAISLFILGLWLKREIDVSALKDDQIKALVLEKKELQEKLETLAEKGQALAHETKQQIQAFQSILTAAGRS